MPDLRWILGGALKEHSKQKDLQLHSDRDSDRDRTDRTDRTGN